MGNQRIEDISAKFDAVLEQRDIDAALSFFHPDCEIQILNQTLIGLDGARSWLHWLYQQAPKLHFKPIVIISEGNIFYEEFLVIVSLPNGKMIRSRQAETLIYENDKIKSLRIYFDPLDFAELVTKDPISKFIVKQIKKKAKIRLHG